jgi:hypothetical protein
MLRRIMGDRIQEFIKHQPNGRLVQPEDIAKTIFWLCSQDTQNIVEMDFGEFVEGNIGVAIFATASSRDWTLHTRFMLSIGTH